MVYSEPVLESAAAIPAHNTEFPCKQEGSVAMPKLDIIIPLYNESEGLTAFHRRLSTALATLSWEIRIIYVNDGSTDETGAILERLAAEDPRILHVELVRNFGHQAALAAGLDQADADALIMLDGDGQHPPELIPRMLEIYKSGYQVVQAQRTPAESRCGFKDVTSRLFYRLMRLIGETPPLPGGPDFRLISRTVLQALRGVDDYHRFYRGLISWLGFPTAVLPFVQERRVAGRPKYSLRKMLTLASVGVFSSSFVPLKLGILLGVLFLLLTAFHICYVAGYWLIGRQGHLVPGWSSLIVLLSAGFGLLMVLLGFIGIYVGMIFEQVRRRPLYIIRAVRGCEQGENTAPRDEA